MLKLIPKSPQIRGILLFVIGIVTAMGISLKPGEVAFSQDISNIARQITVRIESTEPGSGVLISQQGNTYYVLTTKHVVDQSDNYSVITPNGVVHSIADIDIRRIPGVDLAVLSFTSNQAYSVATIGDSNSAIQTAPIWIAGFPLPEQENVAAPYYITNGQITARPLLTNSDGYGLTYSSITLAGMSGGPLLNQQGHLIGIHGLSETESHTRQQGVATPTPGWSNLGIPINIFRTAAPLMEIELAVVDPSDIVELAEPNSSPSPTAANLPASTATTNQSNCVEQLMYKEIRSRNGPDDDGLWRYPVTLIGPENSQASRFGPGNVPGSSMQVVGCQFRRVSSGFLGLSTKIFWECPEPRLRVEAMSATQAIAQCRGDVSPDPTPLATERHEALRRESRAQQDRQMIWEIIDRLPDFSTD